MCAQHFKMVAESKQGENDDLEEFEKRVQVLAEIVPFEVEEVENAVG